jgi:lipid II isoglutaminyl synthase (glutamine-hydrolysing)
VFSNPSGGNMPQGIGSAVVGAANMFGAVAADVAVLEVDEAYGEIIAPHVAPSWVVLTNIQIDQLNRFFEPDRVFAMLLSAAKSATRGVILNGSDANLVDIGIDLGSKNVFQVGVSEKALAKWPAGALAAPRFGKPKAVNNLTTIAEVVSEEFGVAKIEVAGRSCQLQLPGKGLHFAIDSALALALASQILEASFDLEAASNALSTQETVYGRGEIVQYQGVEFQILMMKNPSSMRATLVAMDDPETKIWIAMDDGTPDPSWLFDIDLSRIRQVEVVSGSRAWHFALRLSYAGIGVGTVIPESKKALQHYVGYLSAEKKRGTLITNYEQMMFIRKQMGFLDLESGK